MLLYGVTEIANLVHPPFMKGLSLEGVLELIQDKPWLIGNVQMFSSALEFLILKFIDKTLSVKLYGFSK